jgi:hypothetical protein
MQRTNSPDARKLLGLLEKMQMQAGGGQNWQPFMERAIEPFGGPGHWEQLDAALNKMARAFLIPPAPQLFEVASLDFVRGLEAPPTEVSAYLFDTTAYYFGHESEMAGCSKLATFRNRTANQIASIPSQHGYFQLWQGVTYSGALVIWAIVLLGFAALSHWRRRHDAGSIIALGVILLTLGLVMFGSSCFLVDDQPRFRLPMWQLWWASLFLLIGKTASFWPRINQRSQAE